MYRVLVLNLHNSLIDHLDYNINNFCNKCVNIYLLLVIKIYLRVYQYVRCVITLSENTLIYHVLCIISQTKIKST